MAAAPVRRLVLGSHREIAGTVYGTTVVMATVVAGSRDSAADPWGLAVITGATVVVLWLAHVYSGALADSINRSQPLNRRQLGAIAGQEISIPLAARGAGRSAGPGRRRCGSAPHSRMGRAGDRRCHAGHPRVALRPDRAAGSTRHGHRCLPKSRAGAPHSRPQRAAGPLTGSDARYTAHGECLDLQLLVPDLVARARHEPLLEALDRARSLRTPGTCLSSPGSSGFVARRGSRRSHRCSAKSSPPSAWVEWTTRVVGSRALRVRPQS